MHTFLCGPLRGINFFVFFTDFHVFFTFYNIIILLVISKNITDHTSSWEMEI